MKYRCFLCIIAVSTFFLISSPTPVRALPWGGEHTDQSIDTGSWLYLNLTLDKDDVISGYIETHSVVETIDFFICDASNYDEWAAGYSATVYSQKNGQAY
ncbi:MAG: hypothetical protein ACTSYL_10770 [Candidatus Thorarchaeota archaeon]